MIQTARHTTKDQALVSYYSEQRFNPSRGKLDPERSAIIRALLATLKMEEEL